MLITAYTPYYTSERLRDLDFKFFTLIYKLLSWVVKQSGWSLILISCYAQTCYAHPNRWRATWWSDPATTMAIGWDQDQKSGAILKYGVRATYKEHGVLRYTIAVNTPRKGSTHWAQLTGLSPDTEYVFKVGTPLNIDEVIAPTHDGYHWSKPLWFKTAPNQPKRLTLIAGGDSRNHRAVRRVANRAVAEIKPDVVLFGGDFTSRDTKSQWREWFDDWQLSIDESGRLTPLLPTRGNHDSEKKLGRMWGRAHPRFYYALTLGGHMLRVYTLNSERPAGGHQQQWLERDLKRHQGVLLRWAQYHKPMRPHTRHKSEGADEYQHWASLFSRHNVSLAIECDSHLMKVTWPLQPNRGAPDGFKRAREGTIYIGEGGWGAPLRTVDDLKPWTMASGRLNHVFFLEVEPEGRYHVTPLQLLIEGDREKIPTPWPWLEHPSTPKELKRLTVGVPIMLAAQPLNTQGSPLIDRRATPLRLGYHPLSSGLKRLPLQFQPTYP